LFPLFATSVVDNRRQFATGVVDTSGNLPLVKLIPVVHLHLRISQRIFKKFEMTLMLFSGGWGKMYVIVVAGWRVCAVVLGFFHRWYRMLLCVGVLVVDIGVVFGAHCSALNIM
jgi:hypothetical protein